MNKLKVEVLGDSRIKTNFIHILSHLIPEGVLTSSPLESYFSSNFEFISKYKHRAISTLFDALLDDDDYVDYNDTEIILSAEGIFLISTVIGDRFKEKWKRLADLWNTKYDPLSPFDITLNETTTDTLTTVQDESTSNSNEDTYAFNSEEPTPISKSGSTNESKYSRENPTSRDYTRKGNIGNTSRQELVEQEREVLRYQIIDTIYEDIATVLCRGKYIL